MRQLTISLNALAALRDAAAVPVDLNAAAKLAELAGADALRLGINVDLSPVREEDVQELRRAVSEFELCMPANQSLLKVALEAQPDRVLLVAEGGAGRGGSRPLDLRGRSVALGPTVRALGEAGISVVAVVTPDLESVKIVHAEGVTGIELFTGSIVDLPHPERAAELERLGDAVRLAAKLRMTIGIGGGLGFRTLREVLEAAPAAQRVAVGRAALSRALLCGLDRALRDLRERIG